VPQARLIATFRLAFFLMFSPLLAQQPAARPQASPAPAPATTSPSALPVKDTEKKPPQIQTPTARLTSARNIYFVRTHGGDIPFDTIRTTIDDWERFTLVTTPDKADLIIEISSSGGENEMRVTGGMGPSMETGRMEESNHSSKEFSGTEVSMIVTDAKNKRVLWRGTESAKYAVRQTARENNLVEAAEKLASKFHDRLEPPVTR
jgi:hypothetical protein